MDSLAPLDRESSVVLYRQLADALRGRILDGAVPGGARLPTEFELAATYSVSRGTVRQALGLLVDEGLVERIPGRGTFVVNAVRPASQVEIGQPVVGVIIPSRYDQLSLRILVGVESAAKHRGYQVAFYHSNESLAQEEKDVERMRAAHVAGAIIFPVSDVEYDEAIWQLHAEGFPFVLVDRYFPALDCDYVVVDNFGGGYRATEHLIILGHTEIGFVHQAVGGFRTTSVRDRYRGYCRALSDYNLPFQESWVCRLEVREEWDAGPAGEQAAAVEAHAAMPCVDYLSAPHRPGAVFAANDNVAIRLVSTAARLGVQIPDDLAVVGFDDLSVTSQIHPPLTTISQPQMDMGRRAAHLLIDRLDGRDGPPEHVVLPTSLIVRDSCGTRRRALAASSGKEEGV